MAKRKRLYGRKSKGGTRFYGDFRDFSDVGGTMEALIPEDADKHLATTDRDVARELITKRLKQLKEFRRLGIRPDAQLGEYARTHLIKKAREAQTSQARSLSKRHMEDLERRLDRAVEFFGADRNVATIRPAEIENDYVSFLRELPGRNGNRGFSNSTINRHLSALSDLFRRAVAEELVTRNPVLDRYKRLSVEPKGKTKLVPSDAALFLAAAQHLQGSASLNGAQAAAFAYPLFATALLTGMRRSELLGLLVEDVEEDVIWVRPNQYRRLKTKRSERWVPIFPQLREALDDYLTGPNAPTGDLLFPDHDSNAEERMLRDTRSVRTAIAEAAGLDPDAIGFTSFRKTYCTARLQTLDRGKPVAVFTVSRELGHSTTAMVERVYSSLGRVRHRGEEVSFRPGDFSEVEGFCEAWEEIHRQPHDDMGV